MTTGAGPRHLATDLRLTDRTRWALMISLNWPKIARKSLRDARLKSAETRRVIAKTSTTRTITSLAHPSVADLTKKSAERKSTSDLARRATLISGQRSNHPRE